MPTTTPCARASSPPSNASSWNAVGSPLRPKRRWLVLALSKAGTTPSGCIPHWATARPWPTKLPWRHSKPNRNHPSPPTLHENGSTSCEPLSHNSLDLIRGSPRRPAIVEARRVCGLLAAKNSSKRIESHSPAPATGSGRYCDVDTAKALVMTRPEYQIGSTIAVLLTEQREGERCCLLHPTDRGA